MVIVNTEKAVKKNRTFNLVAGAYARLSLKRKISVPFVSVFLGIWFSGTMAVGYFFSKALEVRQLQEVEGVAWLVLREFQRETQKLRLDAKLLVEASKITEAVGSQDRTALRQTLLPLQTALSLDLIKVVDSEGNVLIDLRNQQSKELLLEDRIAISQVVNSVDLSSVIKSSNKKASILIGTAPIKSARGVIGGIIIGTVVNDELLFEIAQLTNKELVALREEKIIASTLSKAYQFSWQAPPEKNKLSLSEAKITIGDGSYLGKTLSLSGLNNTELKLVTLVSLASLKIAQQKVAMVIIILSFLGVVIAFLVGYGVSNLIATRISRVTRAIEKIANGELKTEVPVTYNDEIDKLAMGFNLMAEQLKERDRTISSQMHKLEETLQQLARSVELIQSEKMSSLGQMVAGIAHEFNNPLSFIYGNVEPATDYVNDLLEAINIYRQEYPNPTPLVEETLSDLELDFVVEDVQCLLISMKNGATRIRDIVEKLKTFSRLNQTGMKKVDIHENEELEVTFAPSSQTSGGIAGVKDEAIDIGIVSRQLTATENTENIQYLAIAIVPMVLVTNESVEEVTNLNAEQIRAIYSAEITNWRELGGPDAEIIILDIPEDESEKQILREYYLGENLNITPKAITFAEDDEILEAAASTPSSIGPIALSKEVEKLPVNILNLDGVAPTVANIKTGKYKLTQTIGIVFRSQTTDAAGDFINYIQSEEAKQKLEEAGYGVLSNP